MFTKILVPLDGSEVAEHALTPALALAKAYKGKLILLCTCTADLENDLSRDTSNDYDWFWPGQSDEAVQVEEEVYLKELMSRLSEADITIQSVFVKGDEAGAIIGISEARDIDLIVMTRHCQSKSHPNQLGHVTERVLHHASCSVMVVYPNISGGSAAIPIDDPGRKNQMYGSVFA